jgi:prevent-host-death family protein
MSETYVSIGRVKRDISDLVNRVAYGGQRMVLTSRGKPKAALVSYEDYQRLQREEEDQTRAHWEAWLAEGRQLMTDILARRAGEPLDLDAVRLATRADLEARDEQTVGR